LGAQKYLPEESYGAAIAALNTAHYGAETAFYGRPHLRGCEQRLCAALPAERRILDAGCGAGRVLGALPYGRRAVGIDVNREAVRVATERSPGHPALNASMTALPFGDGTFDEVWCLRFSFNALPTRTGRVQALREFWRVCAPGGRILVELFNWHHWGRWGLLRLGNILELAARRLQYAGSGRSAPLPDRDILYLANKAEQAAPGYAHLTHREEVFSLAGEAGYPGDTVVTSEASLLSGRCEPVPARFRQYSMWLCARKAATWVC
jgi:SAM-dependent methyltransferase